MSFTQTVQSLPENAGISLKINDTYEILIDVEDYLKITQSSRKFSNFSPDQKDYPFFYRNANQVSYLEYLYIFNPSNVNYVFLNGNKYDIRRNNVRIFHQAHNFVCENYHVLEYIQGHYMTTGVDAYILKNPKWKIFDERKNSHFYLMYCEPNAFTKLCEDGLQLIYEFERIVNGKVLSFEQNLPSSSSSDSFSSQMQMKRSRTFEHEEETNEEIIENQCEETEEKRESTEIIYTDATFRHISPIVSSRFVPSVEERNECQKITFYKNPSGYVVGKTHPTDLYIHQILTKCYRNGRGTNNLSVDHIDRNPLNNQLENLRIANREIQEQNKACNEKGGKRKRMYCAQELPEGITQSMMRKFVNYNSEIYDKQNNKTREFFRVEHPLLKKIWSSSKSNAVPILEKLAAANKVAEDLELGILPEVEVPKTPKYVSLKTMANGETFLVFDMKQKDGKRLNLRKKMPMNFNLEEQIEYFRAEIQRKYDGFTI